MPSYYVQDTTFLNIHYALDIALVEFFSNLLFFDDAAKIEYASTENAFRKRSDNNDGMLNMPFMNMYLSEFRYDNEKQWYSNALVKDGIYIPEIESKLKLVPSSMEFEATFWCNRHDEALYVTQLLLKQIDNHIDLTFHLEVGGEIIEMIAIVNITESFSQTFQEQEWLEKNKIHNVGMGFEVYLLTPEIDADITIPDEVVFTFANKVGDDISREDAYRFVIDHLTETVYPA